MSADADRTAADMDAGDAQAADTASGARAAEAEALAAALRAAGVAEASAAWADRALYATDASHYRRTPTAIARPRTRAEAERALEVCREHGAAVLPRGAGTSIGGQGAGRAVVLDLSRHLNRVMEVDPDAHTARVEPGVVLSELQRALAGHGLRFGPDPSSGDRCTIGGMIGNNACGIRSLATGRTSDCVDRMEVVSGAGERFTAGPPGVAGSTAPPARVTAALDDLLARHGDAVRARFPAIPRRVSGINLDELLPERGGNLARALVGTEGTCVTVLEATLTLGPLPPARALLLARFDDIVAAAAAVPALLAHEPDGLEALDGPLARNMLDRGLHPAGLGLLPGAAPGAGGARPRPGAWLMVEFAGPDPRAAAARCRAAAADLGGRDAVVLTDPVEQTAVWALRGAGVGASSRLAGGGVTHGGWEDAAVAPGRLADYLADFLDLCRRRGRRSMLYGHFGDGCVHARLDFDLATDAGRRAYRGFVEEAADVVVHHGGSLSGEHGDGTARGELLERMFGSDLVGAFAEFRRIFDPGGRMNPDSGAALRPLDADLRTADNPRALAGETAAMGDPAAWSDDLSRCVGLGKCLKLRAGTMCPSFQVTREERHSPRGRSHLLWEWTADPDPSPAHTAAVRDALDLCLGCKACKTECATGVDVARWKSEFLARSGTGRGAIADRLWDAVPWLLRGAAAAPRLAGLLLDTPLAGVVRAAARIHPDRPLPRPAPTSLRRWYARHGPAASGPPAWSDPADDAPGVTLWPDCFTDGFTPSAGRAAVRVLEAVGVRTALAPGNACCGRPLHDRGRLRAARRHLRRAVDRLAPAAGRGDAIVVLEPSCASVFRDDAAQLLPGDPRAASVAAAVVTLDEHLAALPDTALAPLRPSWRREVLLHGHCHQRAVLSLPAPDLLGRLGFAVETPDAGCCGMAGAFGYDRDTHPVAVAAGERVLAPAVRAVDADTAIVTDGFSCRTQVAHLTGRRPLHLAELLATSAVRATVRSTR